MTEGYNLVVTEQKPTGNSIFCEVELVSDEGNGLILGSMYFVCDLKKNITQYFLWMESKDFKEKLVNLGYKIKISKK